MNADAGQPGARRDDEPERCSRPGWLCGASRCGRCKPGSAPGNPVPNAGHAARLTALCIPFRRPLPPARPPGRATSRRNEAARRQAGAGKFFSCLANPPKRLLIFKIIKLTFALGVKLGEKFLIHGFAIARGSFMEIAMDHNLVSLRLEFLKPANESAVFGDAAPAMIIRDDQKRTNLHAMMRQLRHDLFHALSGRRRHVMHRHDQRLRVRLPPKARKWKRTMSQWRRSHGIFDRNQAANKPNRLGTARCAIRRRSGVIGQRGRRSAASLPRHSQSELRS